MQDGTLVRGERVYLRHPRKADVNEFTRLVIASRSFLHPWVTPASTPEAFARYLQNSHRASVCAFVICRVEDQRIIGACNLSQIFRGNLRQAFLGYWVGAAFSGRGYMTDALHLALRYAFKNLKLHRIEANIQPENADSKRLAARVGFRLEGFSPRYLKVVGRWRDHERWAICREDWAVNLKVTGKSGFIRGNR
jgi:[ribosomal protein S5]-alanine N-acetyltransferase